MKKNVLSFGFLVALLVGAGSVWGQCSGLVIAGFNSDNPDEILLLTTANIPANTTFYLTDNEWNGTSFNSGENTTIWTSPSSVVSAGTSINLSGSTASIGSLSASVPALATDGEEIYITSVNPSGSVSASNICFAVLFGGSGTIAGIQSVNIGNFDNALYNGGGITNASNWTKSDTRISPLPITLEYFIGRSLENTVLLSWRTASEQNNYYMAVERSSDGSRWEELGRVTGAGTTTQPQSYSFTDEKPLPGLNYYRLRQVDYDGRFEYHKTIAVDFKTERGGLHLFPSPAQDRLNVALPAPAEQESELWLLNVQGRILQRMVIPQGGTQGAFEVAALPEGVYFVRMSTGDVRSFRFVK